MRAFISKVAAGSMIAVAAIAISACTPKAEPAADNTMVTDMNATDTMATNDTMTATDGAMANDSAMMSNDTTANTATENKM